MGGVNESAPVAMTRLSYGQNFGGAFFGLDGDGFFFGVDGCGFCFVAQIEL